MLNLIRAISQELPNGRIREMSFHRSDSFLYIASLTADHKRESGLWTGELGYCSKQELGKLYKELQKELSGNQARLFTIEVPIAFAAHVERDGTSAPMRKEFWADYSSATIAISGRHKIELLLRDLEGALSWAA